MCQELRDDGCAELIQSKTGLVLDPYFSGTKVAWLLENRPGLRKQAQQGDICFGTVDSWLIWCLTGGKKHVTDYTNASRTLLYNIHDLEWDEELLSFWMYSFNATGCFVLWVWVTKAMLSGIPIYGVAGDQRAALFDKPVSSRVW